MKNSYEELKDLGFDAADIIKMAAHIGGSKNLTVVQNFYRQLLEEDAQIKNLMEISKISSSALLSSLKRDGLEGRRVFSEKLNNMLNEMIHLLTDPIIEDISGTLLDMTDEEMLPLVVRNKRERSLDSDLDDVETKRKRHFALKDDLRLTDTTLGFFSSKDVEMDWAASLEEDSEMIDCSVTL